MSNRYAAALGDPMERSNALSSARWAWVGLMAIPGVATVVVFGAIGDRASGGASGWGTVFLGLSVAWLVLMVPAALVLRSHCLRAAWRGRPVEPQSYVRGLVTIWGTLEVVWLLSLAGVAASQALLPAALPGVVALVLMAVTGPSPAALALDD